jgi:phosphoribosylanthranilate isomerase
MNLLLEQNRVEIPRGNWMVRVKICGITNLPDARAAIDAGADMLGFNFYRLSPRFIEPAEARKIIEAVRGEGGAATTMVGVFVNEPSPEALVRIVAEAGVDGVQLHGDESIEFCAAAKALLNGKLLIKVLRVSGGFEPTAAQGYNADAIMLDAFHPEVRGGTGQVIDWAMARTARELVPRLFLAGGLSPDNVTQATASVRPFGVDACSSLETGPGQKDAELMRAFVRAARNG